jgi:excisionase family DNA binding protein
MRLDVKQVAERVGLSVDTVYDLCRLGLLGHRRVGPRRGKIQVGEEHIAAYLQKAEEGCGAPPQKSAGRARRRASSRGDDGPFKHIR